MLVKGDVKCLHCGHSNGDWVGKAGAPLTIAGYRGPHAQEGEPSAALKCMRCKGPVFLDEAAAVMNSYRVRRIQRLRAQIAALDALPRRARAA